MFKVKVYGAKTLEKYTNQILLQGLRNNSVEADEGLLEGEEIEADAVIFQLHGAPKAEEDDRKIMELIRDSISEKNNKAKVIVLHRPDELQKYPELKDILSKSACKVGLVFFGNIHVQDKFFSSQNLVKKVIPHGFFPIKGQIQTSPIVIGSHTTWGEMRLIEHALKLLLEVFKLNNSGTKNILGYLGGKPRKELETENLEKIANRIDEETSIKFLDVHTHPLREVITEKKAGDKIVLVDKIDSQPDDFDLTFNLQMYYLRNGVRTGESSGTLHRTVGIPVCLEINDAEKIEDLRVIKVPYGNADDINSIDFREGAKKVMEAINNGFEEMLNHNLKQSLVWNNTRIGKEYIKFFEDLVPAL